MDFVTNYRSPLGMITLASDGKALTGLWFEGQKYFGDTLSASCQTADSQVSNSQTANTAGYTSGSVSFSKGTPDNSNLMTDLPSENTIHNLSDFADLPAGSITVHSPAPDHLLVFSQAREWLDIYFSGKEPGFTPPLSMHTTPFRKSVWEILLTIPYGETMTYGQIAGHIAKQRGIKHMSAQAVGGAVGHNSISLIIPCHRVVGSNGSLTGYAGGIDKKVRLLELEGADMTGMFIPEHSTAP